MWRFKTGRVNPLERRGLTEVERALLVHVAFTDSTYRDPWPLEESVQELKELARSSGVEVLGQMQVRKASPTPDLFIGKGKAEELHQRCHDLGANVVIFGEDLGSPQQRNLEERVGVKIIDRTQLILDIFAQRARSREGKVQVELAQLEYLLPRLAGRGILLSRLGGGIGTRGPGEQKLEVDRRRIRLRIGRLQQELEEIRKRRDIVRRNRQQEALPTVALIGYTNAGKSTLLNSLTQACVRSEDRLFTTLDPVARRLVLASRQTIVLSDTVGFIHRLPHHLVEAFQGTLEEVTESHLLLHVVDAAHPLLQDRLNAVEAVLTQLKAAEKPVLMVFNQIDRVDSDSRAALARRFPGAVQISALTGEGLPKLLDRVEGMLAPLMEEVVAWLSGKDRSWLKRIYDQGRVLQQLTLEDRVEIRARVPIRLYGQLAKAGLLKLER